LPKNGQLGEQVARDDVLTGIGPVLTLLLTVERWNSREESFTGKKKGKKEERERKGKKGRLLQKVGNNRTVVITYMC
jgi:hypothetical protein